jgi:hypothetical protein
MIPKLSKNPLGRMIRIRSTVFNIKKLKWFKVNAVKQILFDNQFLTLPNLLFLKYNSFWLVKDSEIII